MSIRTLLISIIVAGVCAGLLALDLGLSSRSGASVESGTRVVGFSPGEVVSVSLKQGSGVVASVRRDEGSVDGWVVDPGTPSAWPARTTRVSAALRELATTTLEETVGEGFEPSGDELELVIRDGSVLRVVFGTGVVAGQTLLRVETRDPDDIATGRWFGRGPSRLSKLASADVIRSWRRGALFELSASEVDSLGLQAGAQRVSLSGRGGVWRVESPITISADRERVRSVLRSVLGLEAAAFVDAIGVDDAVTGLGSPRASITVGWSDRGEQTALVEIGSASVDGRVYAAVTRSDLGSRVLIELDASSIGALTATPVAYARATAGAFGASRVSSLTIEREDGDAIVRLTREGGSWSRSSGTPMDGTVADALVTLVTQVGSFDIAAPGQGSAGSMQLVLTHGGGDAVYGVSFSGDGSRLTLTRIGGDEDGFGWTYGGSSVTELVGTLKAMGGS